MLTSCVGILGPWQRSLATSDSDDSPDVDKGNGCVVALYSALRTKLQAAGSAVSLTWALHQVMGMGLLPLVVC